AARRARTSAEGCVRSYVVMSIGITKASARPVTPGIRINVHFSGRCCFPIAPLGTMEVEARDDALARHADTLVRDAGAVAIECEHHYVVRFGGVPDGGVT